MTRGPKTPGADGRRLINGLGYVLAPANWLVLARRVRRNPEFFLDLLDYVNPNADARRAAVSRLVRHLYVRAFEGDRLDWEQAPKGYARTLISKLAWLPTQLKATPHLGALRTGRSAATRWDYAMLVSHKLLEMKQEFGGYGLGTRTAADCSLPSGTRISQLEVAQAWGLLVNAGHLFGTFATERALVYELHRLNRRDEFLAQVAAPLRHHVSDIFDKNLLYDFFYALACWRVSRAPTDDATRADSVALLDSLLSHRAKGGNPEAHYWAYKKARQLAYNHLHLYLGVGHPVDAVHHRDSVRALSPWSALGFDSKLVEESSSFARMLHALDEYQFENHFAGPAVAEDVLLHVREFKRWFELQRRDDIGPTVDALFAPRPDKWISLERSDLSHFARLKLIGEGCSWVDEVDSWRKDGGTDAWHAGDFVLSPHGRGLIADVYTRAGRPPGPAMLRQVALHLGRHSRRSWSGKPSDERRELWRSIASFGLAVLEQLAVAHTKAFLKPVPISGAEGHHHTGYALIGSQSDVLAKARKLIPNLGDATRSRELEAALLVAVSTLPQHGGDPLLFFLGATYLVDAENNSLQLAEFDGAWCVFGIDEVTWYVLEHKRSAGLGHTADMQKKLRLLNGTQAPVVVAPDVCQGRVAVSSIRWPAVEPEASVV